MKKYLLLWFVFFILTLPGYSQGARSIVLGKKLVNPQSFSGTITISNILSKRLETSFQKACAVQANCGSNIMASTYGPSNRIKGPFVIRPQAIYPNANFLTHSGQLSDYFLTNNNRAVEKFYPRMQLRQEQIQQHLADFEAATIPVSHPEKEDMHWLASRIPTDTNYLLIGEAHRFPEIRQSVSTLLHEIRQRFPEKKIFLFSEFLMEGEVWTEQDAFELYLKQFREVWNTAQKENIPAIGLEPLFVKDKDANVHIIHKTGKKTLGVASSHKHNIWASLEGMKLRNTRWMEVIKTYRENYPDALFIIYAGSWHVEYALPYSLTEYLPAKETFVATLFPNCHPYHRTCSTITSTFDQLTDGKFPQRVLQFRDPALSRLAGMDVQIKVSVFPHEY